MLKRIGKYTKIKRNKYRFNQKRLIGEIIKKYDPKALLSIFLPLS